MLTWISKLKKSRKVRMLLVVVIMALCFSGCGGSKSASEAAAPDVSMSGKESSYSEPPSETAVGTKKSEVASDSIATETVTTSSGDDFGETQEKNKQTDLQIEPGKLTAGEWSDLENWKFWTGLLNNKEWSDYQGKWKVFPTNRYTIVVKAGEKYVCDATVVLRDKGQHVIWQGKTNNKGQAEMFIDMFGKKSEGPYIVTVEAGGESNTVTVDMTKKTSRLVVKLSSQKEENNTLDMMLLVDTTGSMGDELEYLKTELKNVVERVRSSNHNNVGIRVSSNYYRDDGDEYVVRSFPFTTEIDRVVSQINQQWADGGGDFEEAVEVALEDALNNHDWSEKAKARLLFLVLDAPPHHSQQIEDKLHKLTETAAAKGIRIIPVASSGIDKNTEFLLRYLSVSTGGTYVFLTNHSGIGNEHMEPTIGQYEVELLNDLMVRLVNSYIE